MDTLTIQHPQSAREPYKARKIVKHLSYKGMIGAKRYLRYSQRTLMKRLEVVAPSRPPVASRSGDLYVSRELRAANAREA